MNKKVRLQLRIQPNPVLIFYRIQLIGVPKGSRPYPPFAAVFTSHLFITNNQWITFYSRYTYCENCAINEVTY